MRFKHRLRRPRLRRRPRRLFWMLMEAFVLVIIVGLCGSSAMFGAIVGIGIGASDDRFGEPFDGPPPWRDGVSSIEIEKQEEYNAIVALIDYYQNNGGSWEGIDRRLEELDDAEDDHSIAVVIDKRGTVVASLNDDVALGERLNSRERWFGVPLIVEGEQVGTALGWESFYSEPPSTIPFAFLGAICTLGGVLLVASIAFARRIATPLSTITEAAQTVAAGKLEVQVPPARVRELNELATAFNQMSQALSDADRQRKQMTADIAHELRTPLSIIRGRLEGLHDGVYQSDEQQLARLLRETALLERLIEDLRLLALAEAGQLPLECEVMTMDALLPACVASFADRAAAQGVELSVAVAPALSEVAVDPQRMRQVLGNLISNALRYTPAGGSVTVAARAVADDNGSAASVCIEVRDTGSGIAPDDLPHIFDRFWKADRARRRSEGGTGLGLAITRQLVLAHGGTITATSEPGQGTTMHITLPAASTETASPEPTARTTG